MQLTPPSQWMGAAMYSALNVSEPGLNPLVLDTTLVQHADE